ncbi:hypothetical protein KUTeg_023429 [Tegillarca granosa]|uniref:Uncharacterized protein n=1 Tax=Tegillarca granosa TaxID=220873 RepID=A0ABQ9E532_TEGGR|nr:hypothetical protein KUTeg_023429 [Tegillarca granosa]
MWGLIRRQGIQFWINFMQRITEEDMFLGDFVDNNILRFCFVDMIQKTLDEIKQSWNNHRIRSYRNQLLTSGRPWMLHSAPAINRTRDYGVGVDRRDIEICAAEVHHKADIPCDRTVFDICILNIEEHKLSVPSNPDDMYELYKFLRRTVRAEI